MFGINANLKKTAAIAVIAVAGVMGAANASAQQYVAEQMLEDYIQSQEEGRATETADQKAEEKTDSNV